MILPSAATANSVARQIISRIATSSQGAWVIRSLGTRIDPPLLRLSRGRLSSVLAFPALVLTHTGANTGIVRQTPLVYFTDRGRAIVVASNFGSHHNPAWYHNVKANPEVTLYGRGLSGRFTAAEVTGAERNRLFSIAEGSSSVYRAYQDSAGGRRLPLIAFTPSRQCPD
jgi:deazaflavin-dependent oxidoreductase (nitroreductase family)